MKKEGFFGKFKHFFIRTHGNQGTPHLLRTEALFLFFGLALFSQALLLSGALRHVTAFFPNLQNMVATVLPGVLSYQTNEYRQQNQVVQLSENPLLAKAALMKAQDMAAKGYFSHLGPNNEKPWTWMQKAGYKYSYAGENLAVNFVDSSDVTKAWINSPAHKKNLVNPRFTETGIGTAEGMYEGKPTIFVVQFFAAPAGGEVSMPVKSDAVAVAVAPKPAVVPAAATSTAIARVDTASRSIPFGQSATSTVTATLPTVSTSTASSAPSLADGENASSTLLGLIDAENGAGSGTEPAVLGVASDISTFSNGGNAASKLFAALFVNPRQAAKNILLGTSLLVVVLLVVAISHTAGNHKPEGIPRTAAHGAAARLGAVLGAHKRHVAEAFGIALVILSIWALGGTSTGEAAKVPAPIGTTTESL